MIIPLRFCGRREMKLVSEQASKFLMVRTKSKDHHLKSALSSGGDVAVTIKCYCCVAIAAFRSFSSTTENAASRPSVL